MFWEVAEGTVGGEVVERGEGDVVFVGEWGEGEVRVEDAGGGVVFAGCALISMGFCWIV